MVRLIPNNIVDLGRSATVDIAWHFGSVEDCPVGSRGQLGDAAYCVELDTRVHPHRCVVTTPKILRHVLLGDAIQRCFWQSRVLANK